MFSNMRIGGLATGMDIHSIVEDMMRLHRLPVQKLEQNKQILEWQREDYRDINMALRSFRDTAFDMRLQSTYLAMNASSSDKNVLTSTANAEALPGSYQVQVTQLATGVLKGSQSAVDSVMDEDGKIKTLAQQFYAGEGGEEPPEISFTLGNGEQTKEFRFDTDSQTIYDVVSAINDANLGIRASYDTASDRFFLATTATGSAQEIKVTEGEGQNFLSGIGEKDGKDVAANKLNLMIESGVSYAGENAQYSFGDITGLESSTNKVTLNGITMELKGTGESTIAVSNNTEAVFDSIVKFINEYNDLVDKVSGKLYEARPKGYSPLMEEQRNQLTDKQIDQWIEKSRVGLLRNDPILSSMHTQMRFTMSAIVSTGSSEYSRLSAIGITTTVDYMSSKLVINEDRLRQAIENDPEGVMRLFTHNPESEEYNQMGIARRLYVDLNNAMQQVSEKAGLANEYSQSDDSLIGKRILNIEKEIDDKNRRLDMLQERYWTQFTAMEKAVQQMNQQSAWLAQQMGF